MQSVVTKRKDFITFGRPSISKLEEEYVLEVLRSGWLGTGPVTKQFEEEFLRVLGVKLSAVAVNSCTMGIYLCLKAEGIGNGDQVITSPLTFAATVNAIVATGAKPVFCDVDSEGCLDPRKLSPLINSAVKAIIPIHLGGQPCEMGGIMQVAIERNIKVIEDAAHGFGGHYFGTPLGCVGDYGVFSFYPTKNITSGDGGMVVTHSPEKADLIRTLASQGLSQGAWMRYGAAKPQLYEVAVPGFKGTMNDINAAIGLAQLKRWPDLKRKRQIVWDVYEEAFGNGTRYRGHSKHLFTVLHNKREELKKKLHEKGIGTGIHYYPLHLEQAYSYLGYKMRDFPMAENIGFQTLSLPISSTMSRQDAEYVVRCTKKILGEKDRWNYKSLSRKSQ